MVSRFLKLPRVAPGQDHGAGRRAFRIGRVGVFEEDSLASDTIEGGCLDPFRPVGTGVQAPVIGYGEKDVGRGRLCLEAGGGQNA